uniref:FG-GAP-like repeat-containing protein n=1 Tax=Algoriphagus sp. TaxID=1872435 RepID=UPI0025E76F8E
ELIFENLANEWGLGNPIHSNGSAYGDLDNDGAMDLVINNVNNEVLLFKNRSREFNPENHFLKIQLVGKYRNTSAIGTQVRLLSDDHTFYQENIPNRGFQSSVDPILNFGLGKIDKIDELQVRWPDGKVTILEDIIADQTLILKWEEGKDPSPSFKFFKNPESQIFSKESQPILTYKHEENNMVDFDRDRLTYHMLSTEGPKAAWGDIDGDGLEDVYIGGAKGFAGQLFKQLQNGTFQNINTNVFEKDKFSEDTDALFFDANADGSLDLFVSSGGNESGFGSPDLADRLYLNDGKGKFDKAEKSGLSFYKNSTSVVQTIDINEDGHLDLFVGSRVIPFAYGIRPSSFILVNDGTGNFKDGTPDFAPELKEVGMVTDAAVVDYDGDGKQDLVLVGEWMAPTFFKNTGSKLQKSEIPEMVSFKGWYQAIEVGDFNQDGKPDFVLGNHGLNTRFKASIENPIKMFVNDFDQNGSIEHLFAQKDNEGKNIPFTLKHELERQIPSIKKRFLKYASYNDKYLEDIFESKDLENSIIHEVNYLSSAVMINQGNSMFQIDQLPRMAQRSWIYTILITDVNADGIEDLIMGGNLRGAKPEVGQYDASYGEVLIGKGDGTFEFWNNREHGLKLEGDIRDLHSVKINNQQLLQVVKNNAAVEFWKY